MSYITYKQADSRWGRKNYNGSSNMATAGCGPTSVAMLAYAVDGKTNPWDVALYMKAHGYAIRNNGTAWSGIPVAMKAFGLTNVKNVAKMSDVFSYLARGYCAVFLFRSGSRGGVTWTSSGHYVAVTDYKVQNGKHYLYTRDSGGRNHTGWYAYETTMRGLIPQVWVGRAIPKSPAKKQVFTLKKLSVDGKFGYQTKCTMQKWLGVVPDGDIGTVTKKALQKKVGAYVDGKWAKHTTEALQRYLNKNGAKISVDGKFGTKTIKALQNYLNLIFGFTEKPKAPATPAAAPAKTNADKIANMARACAWPLGTANSKYKYPSGSATPEFQAAIKKAYGDRKGWGKQTRAGASCDVFVGTCIRACGYDTTYPRGLDEVEKHMKGNSKWTLTGIKKESQMRPGDVVFYKYKGGGHTYIYLGNGLVANAHYNGKTFGIVQKISTTRNASRCKVFNVYRAK